MDLDTNWCPICDRLITPERVTLPCSDEFVTKLPGGQIPKPKPAGVRPPHPRRLAGGHTRSGSKSGSKPMGLDLLATQATTTSTKPRTTISQAPSTLYCSESCREKDQLSSERFQLCLETMYSGPPSASSLSSPLFVSGSESASDADADALTNESYFAKLRIHGGGKALRQMNGGPDRDSWTDRRHSAGATTASSSEDLPTSSPATTLPPPTPTSASSYGRNPSSSHGRSKSVYDGNAALYAAYPLTFHRTRSGEGDPRSRKNSYSSLCGTSVESVSNQPTAKPTDILYSHTTDTTPTQSPYGIDAVSAQGLLVRPALLRAKSERAGLPPLSPISPAVSDSAPRLYPPAYGSSLPSSKHGLASKSRPSSPTRTPFARKPEFRRRSEVLSQDLLNESSRTRSFDQIPNKSKFLPMYPALPTPTPATRKIKTWVVEGERLVEKEVVEECQEERKRMFHFNTEVS